MNTINRVETLKFWCQKILPLVYDDSLSYYELLCKVTSKLNELVEQNNKIAEGMGEYIAYWLHTPEGEAIMENVITELINENYNNLVTRVGEAEDDIEALEGDVDALEDVVSGHTTSIGTLNDKILRANGMNLAGGNIVFFGDSWTVGGSAGSTNDRWTTITARALGMTEFNYGVGGGGFAISNKILSGVTSAASAMTTAQKNKTTLAVITGGVNDARNWSSQSVTVDSFYAGVSNVVNAAHSAFPNALIVVAIGSTIQYGTSNTYKHAVSYTNKYIAQKSFPVLVINNVLNWVSNTDYYKNESGFDVPIHLTATGHSVFAGYMIRGILGGDTSVYQYLYAPTWDSTYVSSVDGGPVHLWRYDEEFVLTNAYFNFNGDFDGNHVIGTIPVYFAPRTNIYTPIYRGNLDVGTMAVTALGAIHFITSSAIAGAYSPELRWRAY